MDTKRFMLMSPEELAGEQYDTLKDSVVERLRTIIGCLNMGNLEEIEKYLSFSPAGDCMGTDSSHIEFCDLFDGEDLQDVVDKLKKLEKIKGD